jgi:hypothetical protein
MDLAFVENQHAPSVGGAVPTATIESQPVATAATSNSPSDVISPVLDSAPPGVATEQQALADLSATGVCQAVAIRAVVQAHKVERNKAFYTRRIVAILSSLGQIFNMPAGLHERLIYYHVPGSNVRRPMTTEFLFTWARSLDNGLRLKLKTARNHQTQWNRAVPAIRYLKTRKAILDTRNPPLAGDAEELAEILRVLELLEILVDGRDIDAAPPTHSTADQVWKMGIEEWKKMINAYTEA